MSKILITGRGSYIGEKLRLWLIKHEHNVDIADTKSREWEKLDFSLYDVVINVAGIAHIKVKESMRELFYKVNTDLAEQICLKAKNSGCRQYIYLSSMNVYGDNCGVVMDVNHVNPSNFYGDSKLQADKKTMALQSANFNVANVRPPAIYGKGCKGHFPTLVKFASVCPIFPNYKQKKSMLFIDNLCEFIRLLIDNNESGIFCPQNREYTSTSQMVEEIGNALGKRIYMTKIFNPFVWLGIKFNHFISRAFVDDAYDLSISDYFNGGYNVVDFKTSIKESI